MKMVPMPKLSADEKKWRAEEDARALMRAHEIMADASRMKAARPQMAKMAAEKQKEAEAARKAMKKVFGQ